MKNYLSIGEVAKIKNVGIKSLRYYERIGVLIPAYINPETNYRYYTFDQLMVLDTIFLCIELGIPLKNMKNYTSADGQFQIQLLLEDGKKIAAQKIKRIEEALFKIELSLGYINESTAYQGKKGFYTKHIRQRHVICTPSSPKQTLRDYEKKLSELFNLAQEKQIFATFPHGTIEDYNDEKIASYTFLETMKPDFQTDIIRVLPEGDYLCCQKLLENITSPKDIFQFFFKIHKQVSVIITGLSLDAINYDEMLLELQILI